MGSIEYEFERDVNYNYESKIGMNLELNKTCFSKGEIIQGNLFLYSKNDLEETKLINPYIEIKLKEMHYYQYSENKVDQNKNKINNSITEEEEENITLFSETLNFPNYNGFIISRGGLNIPFKIKIPQTAYPSCIFFESNAFVRHFFSINFPSINAKKTLVITIKNNLHFSIDNHLLKSPLKVEKEIIKHKLMYFNSGSFKFSITLPKNFYSYDEIVPFLLDIETENLSFSIKGVEVLIYRLVKLNKHRNHEICRYRENKVLISKYIYITKGENQIHIEDEIKLPITPPEFNPKIIYSMLDNERKNFKYREKYQDIKLYPACYGGLITCNYFIKFIFNMGSLLTTNEEYIILLDFFENFIENNETPKATEEIPDIKTDDINKNNEDEKKYFKEENELPNESEINTPKYNNKKIENGYPEENEIKKTKDNDKDDEAPPPASGN